MDGGDWAVRGTAWLALAGYFIGAFLLLSGNSRIAKWGWGAGCDFNCLHIIASFHFTHNWSHATAAEPRAHFGAPRVLEKVWQRIVPTPRRRDARRRTRPGRRRRGSSRRPMGWRARPRVYC